MQTVMGASLGPKFTICCGTLSSRMRKRSLGIFGMKFPLLSSTDTSTVTRFASLLKVARSLVSGGAGARLGFGTGGASSAFFFGLATVAPASRSGPWVLVNGPSCWAIRAALKRRNRPNAMNLQNGGFAFITTTLEDGAARPYIVHPGVPASYYTTL